MIDASEKGGERQQLSQKKRGTVAVDSVVNGKMPNSSSVFLSIKQLIDQLTK